MWSDNETTQDLLGFRVHADLIYDMITDPTLLPMTIGVFADWGGGKSSILRMLQEKIDTLSEDDGTFCLYVNGWLFEGYDDAKSALISSILAQIKDHPTLGQWLKDKIVPLLKSVDYMRYIKMGLANTSLGTAFASGGLDLSSVMSVLGAFFPSFVGGKDENTDKKEATKEAEEALIAIRDFRDQFSALLAGSKIKSLVVLIDDLDRCSPERIVQNLEAIKLFLNVDRTAFIIGADQRLVEHAIRLHYRGLAGGADIQVKNESQVVKDYLEKIIHVPFSLPRLSVPEVQTYMTMLFCEHELRDSNEFSGCRSALSNHLDEDRHTPLPSKTILDTLAREGNVDPEKLATLEKTLKFCITAAPLVGEGLKGNPRLIKRFLNTYLIRSKMAQIAHVNDFNAAIMVKLMVLEYGDTEQHQALYEFVRRGQGHAPELASLEEYARSESPEPPAEKPKWDPTPFLKRWARMDPPLAGKDLRDYFWLSRDRMTGTLGELDMLPPHLRKLISDLTANNTSLQDKTALKLTAYEKAEVEVVLAEVKRRLVAEPGAPVAYKAFLACVKANVPGSEEVLIEALDSAEVQKMSSEGFFPVLALLNNSSCSKGLISVVDKIKDTKSAVGISVKKALRAKDGRKR